MATTPLSRGPSPLRGLPQPIAQPGARGFRVDFGPMPSAPQIDARGFVAEGQALGAVGQGLQQASSAVQKLVEEGARARAFVQISDAQAKMSSAREQLGIEIAREPDPGKWEAIAQKYAESKPKDWLTKDLSPDARDHVQALSNTWRASVLDHTRILAAKRSITQQGEVLQAQRIRALDSGDLAGEEQARTLLKEFGHIGEDDFARLGIEARESVKRKEEQQRQQRRQQLKDAADQRMLDDPIGYANELDQLASKSPEARASLLPDVDAGDFMAIRSEAQRAKHRAQTDAVQSLRDSIVSGVADDAEIDQKARDAQLGAQDVAELKAFRQTVLEKKASAAPIDWVKAGQLSKDIQSFDPDQPDQMAAVKQWGSLMERVETDAVGSDDAGRQTQSALRQRLWQRHPYHDQRKPDPDLGDIAGEFDDIFDVHEQAGAFGAPAEKFTDAAGMEKSRVPAETAKQSATMRRVLKMELKREAAADPEKFNQPGAVDEWISKRLKRERAGASARSVVNPILPPAGWEEKARAIASPKVSR